MQGNALAQQQCSQAQVARAGRAPACIRARAALRVLAPWRLGGDGPSRTWRLAARGAKTDGAQLMARPSWPAAPSPKPTAAGPTPAVADGPAPGASGLAAAEASASSVARGPAPGTIGTAAAEASALLVADSHAPDAAEPAPAADASAPLDAEGPAPGAAGAAAAEAVGVGAPHVAEGLAHSPAEPSRAPAASTLAAPDGPAPDATEPADAEAAAAPAAGGSAPADTEPGAAEAATALAVPDVPAPAAEGPGATDASGPLFAGGLSSAAAEPAAAEGATRLSVADGAAPPAAEPAAPPAAAAAAAASGPQPAAATQRRHHSQGQPGGGQRHEPPPYMSAMHCGFRWPPQRRISQRPPFLADYPVPPGKTFNVNSFLGRKEAHAGQFLVPQAQYRTFLQRYQQALQDGYTMFLTENYSRQVYKYFVELDWEWDTPLQVVMGATPPLLELITGVASEYYRAPAPCRPILSIRTPFKVHLNFADLLTTELLACECRERILGAARERLSPRFPTVDWERLIDFPHGSLRLMGSRKAPHIDRDPPWVADKAYYPARLEEGRWRPGGISAPLLAAASLFPPPERVAAFERSEAYLNLIYGDLEAYKAKEEERQRRRAERLGRALDGSGGGGSIDGGGGGGGVRLGHAPLDAPPIIAHRLQAQQRPDSKHAPLVVAIEVQPDATVALHVYVKRRFRAYPQPSDAPPPAPLPDAGAPPADVSASIEQEGQQPAEPEEAGREGLQKEPAHAQQQEEGHQDGQHAQQLGQPEQEQQRCAASHAVEAA